MPLHGIEQIDGKGPSIRFVLIKVIKVKLYRSLEAPGLANTGMNIKKIKTRLMFLPIPKDHFCTSWSITALMNKALES